MSMSTIASSPTLINPLTPEAPLWRWAREEIHQRALEMLVHLPGVRAGDDREAVHDMRVGSRRLAAAMKVFHECFADDEFQALYRQARRVTRKLGVVRDQDVLLEYFEKLASRPRRRAALDYVLAHCHLVRNAARPPMLKELARLADASYPPAVDRYLEARAADFAAAHFGLTAPPPTLAAADEPFRAAAARLLPGRCAVVGALAPFVDDPSADEQHHAMRIAVKWLRYSCELFAPAFRRELKRELKTLKQLQGMLGDLHDADVRRDLLRRLAATPLDPDAAWQTGNFDGPAVREELTQLAHREERERERLYRSFVKTWSGLGGSDYPPRLAEQLAQPDAPRGRARQ